MRPGSMFEASPGQKPSELWPWRSFAKSDIDVAKTGIFKDSVLDVLSSRLGDVESKSGR